MIFHKKLHKKKILLNCGKKRYIVQPILHLGSVMQLVFACIAKKKRKCHTDARLYIICICMYVCRCMFLCTTFFFIYTNIFALYFQGSFLCFNFCVLCVSLFVDSRWTKMHRVAEFGRRVWLKCQFRVSMNSKNPVQQSKKGRNLNSHQVRKKQQVTRFAEMKAWVRWVCHKL